MRTIAGFILLALAMIVLIGTISADDLTASSNNTAEATAASNVINPILTLGGYAVLIVGVMIAINAYM